MILSNLVCKRKFFKRVLPALAFLAFSHFSFSQTRNYDLIFSENLKGGTAIFGNTLLSIKNIGINGEELDVDTLSVNSNRADGNSVWGNDFQYMGNIDIDGNSGFGSVTKNSSSADLVLPAGNNNIKLARLYWGGRVSNSEFDLNLFENKRIKIRKGNSGAYSDIIAMGIDKAEIIAGYTEYQAFADVTAFVMHNGKGTYSVGNVPLSTGAIDNGGNNGGWCIVVVYENSLLNYNSVRVYDGFQKVFDGGNPVTTSVTLTGLDVPSGAINSEDAKMGVMCWEGDANLYGDFLKINGNYLWNATNQFYNPWNGTITENGVHVTTKNPDFTNQMGIDIDMFNVGSFGIQPNDTSVNLEFGTEADQYYPGVFTFSIRMKDPTITLEKTVADANKDHLVEVNEILTYTLKGKNAGSGNANGIIIIDTLPNTVTYLPNSLQVISSPGILAGNKTDAANDDVAEYISTGTYNVVVFRIGTGANGATGGTLAENESYELQFQVKVNDPGAGNAVPSVMNIARVKSSSDANVIFVDDGTAIINPSERPLPVTLEKFTASILDDKVRLDWTTSMEINCKEFQVEKSFDGKMFIPIGKVEGNGTTALFHSYFFTDEILPGVSIFYYRLKQIDVDEKYKFSKILPVKYKMDTKEITVSPNPFGNYINAVIVWDKSETVIAKIIGVDGREILSQKFDVAAGKNFITINKLSSLPSGNYWLQFSSSSTSVVTKIFKE